MGKSAKKSAKQPARGRPFQSGQDTRRGQGPTPGAPNAGRPPSEVAKAYRASFADRLHVAERICDNPQASDMARLKALELLGRFGGMLSVQVTGEDGEPIATQVFRFGGQEIKF